MVNAALGSQYNPFRLAKTPEEYTAIRMSDAPYIGVSGSQYAGEEATVAIAVGNEWHHMDVEYARQVYKMLAEVIMSGARHNHKLKKDES